MRSPVVIEGGRARCTDRCTRALYQLRVLYQPHTVPTAALCAYFKFYFTVIGCAGV